MFAVLVRDHERLMLGQSEFFQHAIGDALHVFSRDLIAWVEGDRQVIDGVRDARVLRGGRLHQRRREFGIIGTEVAAEVHAARFSSSPARP